MAFLKWSTLLIAITSCVSAPVYKGAKSDHFDGERFFNRQPMNKMAWEVFKFVVSMPFLKSSWPEEWTDNRVAQLKTANPQGALHVTFINQATVLLRYKDQVILTDPIFSNRASPFAWAGPKRLRPPGIDKEALPIVNVILISHNHYDHLDIESLKWLYRHKGEPLILVGLGVGELLKQHDIFNYIELDWENAHSENGINYTFSECRHRSGRGLTDHMKTLWGAFIIETDKHKVYFAGDTGYDEHFKKAGQKYGGFDLSIIPIGAYEPRWFMKDPHLNPEDAVLAHTDLQSRLSMGIHFGTFQLTYEQWDQPQKDLAVALKKYNVSPELFLVPEFGQSLHIP